MNDTVRMLYGTKEYFGAHLGKPLNIKYLFYSEVDRTRAVERRHEIINE